MKRILHVFFTLMLAACGGGSDSTGTESAKAITTFSLSGVTCTINEAGKTIAVTMPFGTDVTALVATFTTTGSSVKFGAIAQTSATTANNFTNPVTYTVIAADGTTTSYTVTVTVAPGTSKAITAFSLSGVVGTINETNKTIAVAMPFGTDVTALIATFSTTGASIKIGAATQISGTTANNFTNPVTYTVIAADDTTASYTITVTVAPSTSKAITAFSLSGVVGTIDETNKTIAVTIPFGTDVTALVATFTTTGASVGVGAAIQTSGTTANNFTNPVTYTVTAADGTTASYTVTVTVAPSTSKAITAFSLSGVAGMIDETNKTIAVTMPFGTDATALIATFSTTGASVKVGATTQISGTTANNFINPVTFTVTAADGSTTSYAVTATIAPPGSWTGTKQLGVAGEGTWGMSVATDASGNVYVAGYTYGGLDGNVLSGSIIGGDFFVTKYDSSGTRIYTRQLGAPGGATLGNSVATDAGGNVYVAGLTNGGLDGNTLTGALDFFVTKYDSSGTKLYTRQLGVAGVATWGNSVATDSGGNVYVAGVTEGGLDGNARSGMADSFVTKYDSTGTKVYTRQLGLVGGLETWGMSVATDAGGNVYVAGDTGGGLDGNTLTGTSDFFVTKYDSSGTKVYTRQLGVAGASTWCNSVATDAGGNVYVAGHTTGGLDGNTLTGTLDFFVTKYDSSGTKLYTRQLGVAGARTWGYSVATDAGGNAYVAGPTYGGLDGNTSMGSPDFFVTKYDSSGTRLYTKQLGVAGAATYGNSVATDAGGNVYVAGDTGGGLDGNTSMGYLDFFVTKYSSSGVKQ